MDTAPQSIVRQPPRSRPAKDDRRCIALFVPGCRAALLRARDPSTPGARRVASRGCSVRGACRGVGLAFGWYSDRERAGHRVYRVENLTASMFANSSCHMKGAETSSFLGFVVVLADRWKHAISDGVMLWNAGVALDSAIDLCRQSAVGPPSRNAGAAVLTARHLDLMVRCHVHPVPKCHVFLHFAHASNFLGNPWFYTTFEDESQNRRLAMIAAGAHRAQGYRMVLLSWRLEFGDRARRSEREPRRRRLTERSAETQ